MSIVEALFGPENHLIINYLRVLFFASLALVFTAPVFAAVHCFEKSKRCKFFIKLSVLGCLTAMIVFALFLPNYQLINESGVGFELTFFVIGVSYLFAVVKRFLDADGNLGSLKPVPIYGLIAAVMLFLATHGQLMI